MNRETHEKVLFMTIAAGTIQCQLGTAPLTGCGFSYSADELDTALSGPVASYEWEVGV